MLWSHPQTLASIVLKWKVNNFLNSITLDITNQCSQEFKWFLWCLLHLVLYFHLYFHLCSLILVRYFFIKQWFWNHSWWKWSYQLYICCLERMFEASCTKILKKTYCPWITINKPPNRPLSPNWQISTRLSHNPIRPKRIYNPITAMGFSALFTFQLYNTKR